MIHVFRHATPTRTKTIIKRNNVSLEKIILYRKTVTHQKMIIEVPITFLKDSLKIWVMIELKGIKARSISC